MICSAVAAKGDDGMNTKQRYRVEVEAEKIDRTKGATVINFVISNRNTNPVCRGGGILLYSFCVLYSALWRQCDH